MRKREVWIGVGLVALAIGLRLVGLDWGLPEVYEEAYPFKKAWPMWGWGHEPLDLNPHFFNYPSLFFYVQWLGQGLLFLLLRLFGVVHSVLDYRALYELDKTPFYLMGRTLTVLFAAGTVWVTWSLGRRLRGPWTGALAAFLLAVNAFHVSKSQVIEVDVPLTFFVMLTLGFALRLLEEPRRRYYILAGVSGGLAAATKYSGLFLLLPILAAHVLAWRRAAQARGEARGRRPRQAGLPSEGPGLRREPLLAFVVFGLAFLAASPYVLLDFPNFWIGFNYERLHLELGHFGLDASPAFPYYVHALAANLLGWPLALLSLAALVLYLVVRRCGWALVLGIFPLVYVAAISSFSMKAERYVLPLVPIACLLAAALVEEMLARVQALRPRLALPAGVAAALVLAAPAFVGYAHGLSRLRDDTRTLARQWLEANVPGGAYLVCESYGPEPLTAVDVANFSEDLRERVLKQIEARKTKIYAIYPLPMLQVGSQYVTPFYALYRYEGLADYIVTSSSVSSRYRKDPALFAPMLSFYDSLAARWTLAKEFGPADGTGPRLSIYKNPRFAVVFARRGHIPSPAALPPLPEPVPRVVGPCYQREGVNLETFGYFEEAAQAFLMASDYAEARPNFRIAVITSALRCYLRAGRSAQVFSVLDLAERGAKTSEEREYWRELRRQVQSAAEAPKP